jgi:hypothetical protein
MEIKQEHVDQVKVEVKQERQPLKSAMKS